MESPSGSHRLFRYDNVKFWAILMVVVGHFAEPYVDRSHAMKSLWIFIYSFHMPLFIFLAGLFSKRVIQKPKFPGEKIYSYLALFTLYKILLYCTKLLCGAKASFSWLSESGVPWFMLSCALFLFFTTLIKGSNRKLVFGVAVFCACLAGYNEKIGDFLCLSRTIVYYPFFLLGYYLELETLEAILHNKYIRLLSLIFLFSLAVVCFFCTDSIYPLRPLFTGRNPFSKLSYPQWGMVYRILYYIGVSCLLPGILWLASGRRHFFTNYGTKTLQIYFLHRPVLYLYQTKFHINTYLSEIFPTTWKIFYLLSAVGLTVLLAFDLFETPFRKIMDWNPNLPRMKGGPAYSLIKRIKLLFPVAFFLAFTLGFFGPMDMWHTNAEELWFGRGSVFFVALTLTGMLLGTILLGASLLNGTSLLNYITFLFGLSLAVYFQGTFLNIRFGTGVLDGGAIDWGVYELYGIGNTLVWGILLVFPVLIRRFVKNFIKIFSYISAVIVLMQSSALIALAFQTGGGDSGAYTITTDGMYTLSKNENILIFALDTMDEQYFSEFLADYPDAKENLAGFTHFDNTLASGARTILALPSMLTGVPFKQETTYTRYVEKIWNGETPLDLLSESGYDVRAFSEGTYYGSGAANCIKNFSTQRENIGNYNILTKKMGKLSLYRYCPFILKKLVWFNTAEFDEAKANNVYSPGDAKFYNNYKKNGFTYTNDYAKAFRFYLLEGAHQPYTLTAMGKRDKNGTSRSEQVAGSFHILFEMLEDLKEAGMFESAMIIITADHGDKNYAQHPILLCKPPFAQNEFQINHAPISLFDLPATLADYAGGRKELYGSGRNLFQISEDENRQRFFYLNTAVNSRPCIQEYSTNKRADDLEGLYLKQEYFVNNGDIQPYVLGETLSFAMDATANQYCIEGFRLSTGWRTPLAGPHAQMIIPLEEAPTSETLHASFGVYKVDNVSHVVITSNEIVIFEGIIDQSFKEKGLELSIPVSSLKDNAIKLEFSFTDIDPLEMNLETEKRTMTVSFDSLIIQ